MAVGLLSVSSGSQAQTAASFTPDTPFNIPDCNGTIYFAFNGSCAQARLENSTWVFSDLQLAYSTPVASLRVGTKNCNITITSFSVFLASQNAGAMHYNVTGPGIQTFNFGLSPAFGLNPKIRDLMVFLDSDPLTQNNDSGGQSAPEGSGWTLSEDGTITVTGAAAEAFIFYSDHSSQLIDNDLPFYQSHPVLMASLVLVAGVVLVGVAVKVKSTRPGGKP